ncbi:MAG: transposase [Cyanobacteria bacterium P01_A01_bin.116]
MAPRKLSDADKSEIIDLYKQSDQTTSTLAGQYGVSNSTISRILKTSLPPEEYSALIAQKRMAGSSDKTDASPTKRKRSASKGKADVSDEKKAPRRSRRQKKNVPDAVAQQPDSGTAFPELASEEPVLAETQTEETRVEPPKLKTAAEKAEEAKNTGTSRRRKRSRRRRDSGDEQLPLLETEAETNEGIQTGATESEASEVDGPVLVTEDEDDDDLTGLDETLGDDFGDDDLDEEVEDDDDDNAETPDLPKPKLATAMSIMPLDEAVLPKPCYLVIDMRSELITRPLSDFADLGQIPSSEEKAKTLPVFDNHRVARRFSRNKQRVIKVPDGSLITRTSPYLEAKGITRLLVDGQVFDLVSH